MVGMCSATSDTAVAMNRYRCSSVTHTHMRQGASGWHPGKGRGMPSSHPNQRSNARVSACKAGLVKTHREHKSLKRSLVGGKSSINIFKCGLADLHFDTGREYGLVDHLIDIGRDPVPIICIAPRAPGASPPENFVLEQVRRNSQYMCRDTKVETISLATHSNLQ